MKKIAVIDGDSICYICSRDTVEESISNAKSLMNNIKERSGCTHYYLFLSDGKYFRHKVNPDYKGNRKGSALKFLRTLKAYLKEEFGGIAYEGLESDDLSAYVMNNSRIENAKDYNISYLNCSPDKDVRKQVWGNWFDYRSNQSGTTSREEAMKFLYLQALMGDSTDNIKGLPGIGEKKAEKILDINGYNAQITLGAYLGAYEDNIANGIFEFQKNFRQVYLLREDIDFLSEVGYVPELLEPRTFIKEE